MRMIPALLIALALVGGCPAKTSPPVAEPAPEVSPAPADRVTCCAQCSEGARTDPAGMDLSLEPCAGYAWHTVSGRPVMTEACAAWFAGHPLMVQDCRL